MEQQKNTLLQVAGILMIIGGVIGIIGGVLLVTGSLLVFSQSVFLGVVLVISGIITVAAAVLELVAGIKGKNSCFDTVQGASCMKIGLVVLGMAVVGKVLSLVGGSDFSVSSLISGLIVPGLYVYAAYTDKQKLGQ